MSAVVRGGIWLSLLMAIMYPAVAWPLASLRGADAWLATGIACVLCWVGAATALVIAGLASGPSAVSGVLLGMFVRTGLPLVGGLMLEANVPVLAAGGLMPAVLVVYFAALVVETLLAVRMRRPCSVADGRDVPTHVGPKELS